MLNPLYSKVLRILRCAQWLLIPVLTGFTVNAVIAHPGQHEQLNRVNRAIEQQPRQQRLYVQRGAIYTEGGQYPEAQADFQTAEQLGPVALVAMERGVLYYRMGELDRAMASLNQFIEAYPGNFRAYEYRARIARGMGNYAEAVDDLRRYFQVLNKPHPGNYISAADMLVELDRTREALALLDQGVDKLGTNPQLQRRAIELELTLNNTSQAITRQQKLRVALGGNANWKVEMAELLQRDNRYRQADKLLLEAEQELLELRPTPARLALLQRARDLQQIGRSH